MSTDQDNRAQVETSLVAGPAQQLTVPITSIRSPSTTSLPSESDLNIEEDGMTETQAYNLYLSHLLSTWNIRTYEFAVVIFTAAAYPDTLSAAAIRGIVRQGASICLSSIIGRWVDRNPDRLKTLLDSVSINRVAVVAASALWYFILLPIASSQGAPPLSSMPDVSLSRLLKGTIFSIILALGLIETLSGNANMLSMERDWVVTVAAPDGHAYDLTHLNAVMRRIDLICKLLAPIFISTIISATDIGTGVLAVGTMSACSWGVEIWCARRVWDRNPKLKAWKAVITVDSDSEVSTSSQSRPDNNNNNNNISGKVLQGLRHYARDYKNYFSSIACIPSLSLALLHFSALSYGATFITFLLNVGFSLDLITIARAAGSIVEISSTVVTPIGVHYLGKASTPQQHGRFRGVERRNLHRDGSVDSLLEGGLRSEQQQNGKVETGLERLGLWGLSWQLINLIPVLLALWSLQPPKDISTLQPPKDISTPTLLSPLLLLPTTSQRLLAFCLFTFLSVSRLGLWVFDLTTQQLTQTLTPPPHRSSFTGVEYSFTSLFELAQHILVLSMGTPLLQHFKWIALSSFCSVGVSTVVYATWVWWMRGHLLHWEKFKYFQ